MFLLFASFFAGVLTSLAPCILPLLPVIVGSSSLSSGNKKLDRKKPYVIAISLGISVIVFTLLLKASTVLIGVDPKVWVYLSGGIVLALGVAMLFPMLWVKISARLGFEQSSNKFLARAAKRKGFGGQILTGAALGPVFSSCSPVYALVLATVLPVNLALGMVYIVSYALGLSLALLAIALLGRKLTSHLGWTANPNGWFRRVLAIILILVGLAIIAGFDKKFQTWAIEHLPFDATRLEEKLLPSNQSSSNSSNEGDNTVFNVDKPRQAAEIAGIQNWINSDGETLADLRGKVVLIDFWTYSCINCQRTQPYLNDWYGKYKGDGLTILGIHAPEFAFEKVPENVRKAVKDAKINYPVGLDNDFTTWKAYDNQFWPAKYLIDKNGKVRYTHFGEGDYKETETAIQALLKETGAQVNDSTTKQAQVTNIHKDQTPETYLGFERGERFVNIKQFKADVPVDYASKARLTRDQWRLGGSWQVGATESVSKQDGATLGLNFSAKEVYLVMSSTSNQAASVKLDGKKVTAANQGGSDVDDSGALQVSDARLYRVIRSNDFIKGGALEITVPAGTTVNAFTFGS